MNPTTKSPLGQLRQLRALLFLCLLWLIPTLACGSFAPRPTPTPSPIPAITNNTGTEAPSTSVATPLPQMPTDTPVPEVTEAVTETEPTPAPPPTGGNALAPGQQARVTAPAGLNYRESPSSSAALIGQFGTGQLVTILEGPVSANNFTWWRIDDGSANVGWAADGDGETVWISPQLGDPQPVNRAPRVGDRVVVSTGQLSIRSTPGTNAPLVTRANPGQQFTVLAGPQSVNGLSWYQIRSDNGSTEGWAADGDGTTRWLSPLE